MPPHKPAGFRHEKSMQACYLCLTGMLSLIQLTLQGETQFR